MAEWIDEEVETAHVGEGETLVESDQVTESLQAKEPEPVEAEQTQQEDDIPARYRGKSIQDVIQMHREAEKALGQGPADISLVGLVLRGRGLSAPRPPRVFWQR